MLSDIFFIEILLLFIVYLDGILDSGRSFLSRSRFFEQYNDDQIHRENNQVGHDAN